MKGREEERERKGMRKGGSPLQGKDRYSAGEKHGYSKKK